MDGITKFYLINYNNLCCIGWAYVLYNAVLYIFNRPEGLAKFVIPVMPVLLWVQMAAIGEIFHSYLGIVRSPTSVVFKQVSSRVIVLLFLSYSYEAQISLGAGLMVLSWALVEVPRYAFYLCAVISGDATKGTPYWLFWLRYTLFIVLYPSGITGEILVYFVALNDPSIKHVLKGYEQILWGVVLFVYLMGSPVMIINMAMNRKNAFKKRFAKPPPPARGLVFPLDAKGTRSSTQPGKEVLGAALGSLNPEKADKLRNDKKWRFGYVKHFRALVEEQCKSPEAALKAARAGLDKAYDLFEFISEDGSTTQSLKEAMAKPAKQQFLTGFVKGEAPSANMEEMEVPYKNENLKGEDLKRQVKEWVSKGIIEGSAGDAISRCVDHPEWIKDIKKYYFCLLGAGSAMGPFEILMSLGANVIAIDLDRPKIWKRLLSITRNSSGTLTFPLKDDVPSKDCDQLAKVAGCNLFTQTPMIRDWLLSLYPDKPIVIGSYAYLDGAAHVQVSLAMDAICKDMTEKRQNTSLAYLCTPTDLHLIPKEASEASLQNFKHFSSRIFCKLMRLLNPNYLVKNALQPISTDADDLYMVNGLAVAQGPNYALAKRLQHWRAIIAHQNNIVSSNIAPSTSTVSVVHNRQFAWAYEGMPYFTPFEIFKPDSSNAVMTALLFNDLFYSNSVSNNSNKLQNPNQLFQFGSFHGGAWRCAYQVGSIGEASVAVFFISILKPYLFIILAVAGAVLAKLYLS